MYLRDITLARSFRQTNPTLDGRALTEVTQRILDRLIFIRFVEDKLIEPDYRVANFGVVSDSWWKFVFSVAPDLDGHSIMRRGQAVGWLRLGRGFANH